MDDSKVWKETFQKVDGLSRLKVGDSNPWKWTHKIAWNFHDGSGRTKTLESGRSKMFENGPAKSLDVDSTKRMKVDEQNAWKWTIEANRV